MIKDLMKQEKVNSKDRTDKNAEAIYNAVKDFIANTGFSVPVYRPKY